MRACFNSRIFLSFRTSWMSAVSDFPPASYAYIVNNPAEQTAWRGCPIHTPAATAAAASFSERSRNSFAQTPSDAPIASPVGTNAGSPNSSADPIRISA